MTTARRLAALAKEATRRPDTNALRVRALATLVVALSRSDDAALVAAAPRDEEGSGAAAFRLAAATHALTQDDFHPCGRVHVGAPVIPAVFATGDEDLVPGMAAGYEVLTAIAEAYSGAVQRRGYRPTGVIGPIRAAAAVGVAVGLNEAELATALSPAAAMAGGTSQSWIEGGHDWRVEVAVAAGPGVDVVRPAAVGATAAPQAFEGSSGWTTAFFDDPRAEALAAVLDG